MHCTLRDARAEATRGGHVHRTIDSEKQQRPETKDSEVWLNLLDT